jgi:hypothetical protein
VSGRIAAHLRRNVVAYVALFVALSGTTYAAVGRNSVGPKQLKTDAVRGPDALESSFSEVPSAASATNAANAANATNAANASQLDGLDSIAFQRGGERIDDTEDTTPSAAGVSLLILNYGSNTVVTNLTGGVPGQVVTILGGVNVDINDGGAFFFLNGSWIPDINDTLTVIHTANNAWVEVGRSGN